jgi:hypothetical protein
MNVTSSKILYYLLRAFLVLLGLFLRTSSTLSILNPEIAHSESSDSASRNTLIDVCLLIYGGVLLVPFRWLSRSFTSPFALLGFAAGILWAAYTGMTGLVGLMQSRKSWIILPVSAVFVLLALSAPLALAMRRRLDLMK